ncbi:MAG: fasciclin domain-containing protein [Rhodothermaceae bacterium]|nr:fasciclin domain-containing protein [Rhodothermaceae bacterium]
MKKHAGILAILFSVFTFVSCDSITDSATQVDESRAASRGNAVSEAAKIDRGASILDIASTNPDFSILAQVVVFAGLDEALGANRQLTVFAPTNDAFVALLGDLGENLTLNDLLVEGNKELLTSVLLYHVAPGRRFSKSVIASGRVNTLLEEFAFVQANGDGGFEIGNGDRFANIVATDISARNGVIHVIDRVLLPPAN